MSSCHPSLFNLQQVVVNLIIKLLLFSEKLLNALIRQTEENSVLLRQALAELKELKMQVQSQRKIPFTVKTCGFEVHHLVSFILSNKTHLHICNHGRHASRHFSFYCFILQRELVLKAKEVFVTYGPWLVQGALDKLKVSLVFNFKNNNIICF